MLKRVLTFSFIFQSFCLFAQEKSPIDMGKLSGNFQLDAQYYQKDTVIHAPLVPEKIRYNSFFNLNYVRGKLGAGVRFESYEKPLLGFDPRYEGTGIPYKYISYRDKKFTAIVGNYYEQFGSGMLFRSYEERGLGYDNAMQGLKVTFNPAKGVYLKGVFGKQRFFFSTGPGVIRGLDAEWQITETFDSLAGGKLSAKIGGSAISTYQKDQDPNMILPENVFGYAGRASVGYGDFALDAEYVFRYNFPSAVNKYIYRPGQGLLINATYTKNTLGVSVNFKRTDNLNFRTDRAEAGNNLNVNFLPALTKQHTYALAATIYPYASQPNGEMAAQAEVSYQFPAGTALGGSHGMTMALNYSRVHGLDTSAVIPYIGYESSFTKFGKRLYFQDLNFEISRKLTDKLKLSATYINLTYDKDVVQGLTGFGVIKAHIGIVEIGYKIKPKHNVRVELQTLATKQDEGSWAMALIEYSIAPKWFFAILDNYNYGNSVKSKQVHYFNGSFGYTMKNTRFIIGYGRQRAGIFCVGGVCRNVPASNGLTFSIFSTF